MPVKTEYKPGTPSWVDLGSTDIDASGSFYGKLFGWEEVSPGPPEQTGGYRMFTLGGKTVAGVGPLQAEGQPPAWTTYVTVKDADQTAKTVRENGGNVLMEPMDVMDVGRMAVFADPEGAVISVWQPRAHKGAELVNEPGAFTWNELNTRDAEAAKRFYQSVFGWQGETYEPNPIPYTEWKLDGNSVGGMIQMTEEWPAEVPPHWLVYFSVANCDETVEKAKGLGASVLVEPRDIQPGRFAVLTDPQGAAFAVFQVSEGMSNN
jgi:predicted enzyme related to lactoylglutathione lyase